MSEDFLCLNELKDHWAELNISPYPHQLTTLDRVVNELGGRALLADEVGLGKTFEAAVILKEYLLRGHVKKALIITPSSLVNQWYQELTTKFKIDCYVNYYAGCWNYSDCTIASIDTAKRKEHAIDILDIEYDIVIVDEAHKLKNEKTQNYQLVKNLKKKFLLLLTATPIQNDLKELYNLISLVKPNFLGTYRTFKSKFMKDKCEPKNADQLRSQLQQIMVRNNRKNINLDIPARNVQLYPLELSDKEQLFYDSLTDMVRKEYVRRISEKQSILGLITLQREICSSSFAAKETLARMKEDQPPASSWREQLEEMYNMALNIKHNEKYNVVKSILENELQVPENKVIIFTEYLATQEYICRQLIEDGYKAIWFNGQMDSWNKYYVLGEFAKEKQIMVSTESGGEGLNLQFSNIIINYDLPWNPMRVEQKIGRVHRLGQKRPVNIYNLCTKNTIEEIILTLLYKKIDMFEKVIGGLELILNKMEHEKSIETRIMDILMSNQSKRELESELEQLGATFEQAKSTLARQQNPTDAQFGVY